MYIERFSNDTYALAPCCLAKLSDPLSGPVDFINNQYLNSIRNQSKPDACNNCWELEKAGGTSKRMMMIDKFKDIELHGCVNIDYSTVPVCNARCIICSSRYSSAWAQLGTQTINIKELVKNTHDHMAKFDFNNIKTIYFNGGEPLLTDEHEILLEKINNLSNVDIYYNTNGSCYPNNSVLNLWQKTKSVTLFFSIDAIGKRFEEIRSLLKWDIVSDNIKKINSLNMINVECSYTIGRHNVYDLEETIAWFDQLPNFNSIKQFHVHYVSFSHYLFFNQASDVERKQFKKELTKFKNYHWYQSIVEVIQ